MKLLEKAKVKEKLDKALLYCITSRPKAGQSYEEMVEDACKGGADIIQLREKNLSAKEFFFLAQRLKGICHRYETLFIVNDRVDIALAAGADGVHLGQEDLPLIEARKIVDAYFSSPSPQSSPARGEEEKANDFLIGVSAHSLEQALKAEREGADYVGCGPIFSTPTKPDYKPVGLDLIRKYRNHLQIPFVAIGGIDQNNLQEVLEAGARCVAVVRAVCGSEDVEGSARRLKNKIMQTLKQTGFQ